jgi:hypothetical protein
MTKVVRIEDAGVARTGADRPAAMSSRSGGPGDGHMQIAGAYVRKSSVQKEMAAGLKSVEQQADEIRKFAASRGWKLDERYIYTDDEISGEGG